LWVNWDVAAVPSAPAVNPERMPTRAQETELGDRVGTVVAGGDCDGGERLAIEAGDLALARAVRDHCNRLLVAK
jgi:hypothetical protein